MATLNTLEKAGRVLDLFTRANPEWRVTEVATELGWPRSSAHALLSSLVDIGILMWRPGGRYRIGWRIMELSEIQRLTLDLRSTAQPVLERLVDRFGETVHLGVREQYHVLYLDKFRGTHNVVVQGSPVGSRAVPHCTGLGKVIMAGNDADELDDYLKRVPLRKFTEATITDPKKFLAEIATIRRQGYAYDRGEAIDGLFCVAAPVRDDLGQVVAAISISAPQDRFERLQTEYTKGAVEAAGEISRMLVDSRLDTE
ncbi:MAG: IclR family transcriptional regulator, partial [Propionibacterium sp.]|nr:IclR family transcriptional regulator [Propionibacterium sp.]